VAAAVAKEALKTEKVREEMVDQRRAWAEDKAKLEEWQSSHGHLEEKRQADLRRAQREVGPTVPPRRARCRSSFTEEPFLNNPAHVHRCTLRISMQAWKTAAGLLGNPYDVITGGGSAGERKAGLGSRDTKATLRANTNAGRTKARADGCPGNKGVHVVNCCFYFVCHFFFLNPLPPIH
jgi:hypothetical protein